MEGRNTVDETIFSINIIVTFLSNNNNQSRRVDGKVTKTVGKSK